MARNSKPWFKLYYRDWLESESVSRMSPSAQGIYFRCICLQAIYGTIPTDLDDLFSLLRLRPRHYADLKREWPAIATHFTTIDCNGEQRCYNEKQREILESAEKNREAKSNGGRNSAEKRGFKFQHSCEDTCEDTSQDSCEDNTQLLPTKLEVRASVSESVSVSNSDSKNQTVIGERESLLATWFDRTWKQHPRKVGKAEAFLEYKKLFGRKPDEALAYLIHLALMKAKPEYERLMEAGESHKVLHFCRFLSRKRYLDFEDELRPQVDAYLHEKAATQDLLEAANDLA
jgi:hypothetical protein